MPFVTTRDEITAVFITIGHHVRNTTYRRTFGPWHAEVAESPQKASQGPLIDKSPLICNLTPTKFYYRFKF